MAVEWQGDEQRCPFTKRALEQDRAADTPAGSRVRATRSADLLTVVAAVVIGGTRLFGGEGSVIGALVGSLIMGMLTTQLHARRTGRSGSY
jgi:hypothetical protein